MNLNENLHEIDYTEKIRNFQAMIDNYNEEIALEYLTQCDWDETQAAQLYFNKINNNSNNNLQNNSNSLNQNVSNIQQQSNNINIGQNPLGNKNRQNYTSLNQNDNENQQIQQNSQNEQNSEGFLSKYVVKPLGYVASFFCGRTSHVNTSSNINLEDNSYSYLLDNIVSKNGRITNLNSFSKSIKHKLGLIIFFDDDHVKYLENLMNDIKSNEYVIEILKENYVVYPIHVKSTDGLRTLSLIPNELLYPSFILSYSKHISDKNFNMNCVIDKLEGQIDLNFFIDWLIQGTSKKNELKNNEQSAQAKLIEDQINELKRLESLENKKAELEKEEKLKKQRMEEEEIAKAKEYEEIKNRKKSLLKEEPNEDEPNITTIVFRFPDGVTRKERRFYRSDKIGDLYNYVDSLGKDIFEESEEYDLIQQFPFKIYTDRDVSLEDEKLFPNAVVQIREL